MSSDVVIRGTGISKVYNIFRKPEDRLKQMIFRRRKFFDEYWALKDVSLEIRRGETVALVGRNGSGKSTLLQIITGTLLPTTGSMEIEGRVGALLELGAGFNPEFTGRENVYMSAQILGLARQEVDARFDTIAAFADIGDFIDQPVKLYSSGMYARLAFSVMAHVDTDILIVDEILAVGDAAFTQKCMRFIRKFKETGTLLFVSHDVGAVLSLCDTAVWMDAGMVRAHGPAREICEAYQADVEGAKGHENDFRIGGSRKAPDGPRTFPRDHREEALKELGLQGKGEVFAFDPDAPWYGQRGATIEGVQLLDADGAPLTSFEGGEDIRLEIRCRAERAVDRPIVGFNVKDRLGQSLFGDNTFLTYRDTRLSLSPGDVLTAAFDFRMPYLAGGDYSLSVAVASGTQDDHVQHHWVDDAMFFKVTKVSSKGLMGIPMRDIRMSVSQGADSSPKKAL
ncbi:ABC transporter ATP-binding protein [Roseomonas sp. E05]|uniref:ABC transporter ATP-binding protein n=1 Tax=Roseomonas sp. E05 TaxID=3046310 RepID=UPI0024BB8668|nr:ABC transporter ATP-binding protein [Roseomonas sp. E05]MDJ0390562.1 ABC transporter ATP-binding protein [Roseomonas sp. E05]